MIELSKRIGVLTGGGDTPALNATLKGIALECEELGFELIGLIWINVESNWKYRKSSNYTGFQYIMGPKA